MTACRIDEEAAELSRWKDIIMWTKLLTGKWEVKRFDIFSVWLCSAPGKIVCGDEEIVVGEKIRR